MRFNSFTRPTFREAKSSLNAAAKIERPEGDNHHLTLDSHEIMASLPAEQQSAVEDTRQLLYEFVRNADGEPDRRSINTLIRNGFPAGLGPDQYDPCRMVGYVQVGDWRIDLSDSGEADGTQD